jgi:hypothetical protein
MQQATAALVEQLGLPAPAAATPRRNREGGLAHLPKHPLDPLCAQEYEQAS